jgi:CYTH domain-containing protein/CHAD domain-containing protein
VEAGDLVAYRVEPDESLQREVRRVAGERLADALVRLDGIANAEPDEISEAVHEVRKRCKELRGLARLVRPALGKEFAWFNNTVRDAAVELSSIRDAHAILATFDVLRASHGELGDQRLHKVHTSQAALAGEATLAVRGGDRRIRRARKLLIKARRRVRRWEVPDGFDTIGGGLGRTYERGRRAFRDAHREPADERMHEWRKLVKTLWYQVRLLEQTAPSVLTPLIARLDELAEALGDDHDLAVLIEQLDGAPRRFGGRKAVKYAVRLARAQQDELRTRSFRLGATLYAERTTRFVSRMGTYWDNAVTLGPERSVGGIAALAEVAGRRRSDAAGEPVERERKYLVVEVPEVADGGAVMRQRYLAIDGTVSVRVRDAGKERCTLTVKAGRGPVRVELEWQLEREQFEAVWELGGGRQVSKTRYRVAINGYVVELDVFAGELDGLVMAEVEFDSDDALAAFEPPAWFGREVTSDVRYTNASLAVDGLEPDMLGARSGGNIQSRGEP